MKLLVIAIAMIWLASPAIARVTYAEYDGPDAVREGKGGAKITKDGVDFWTTGQPPRKYRVIGVLTDGRYEGLISGTAVGAAGLAKRVRDHGGDALIVIGQNNAVEGAVGTANVYGSGRSAFASTNSFTINKTFTQFLVVKYLDQ